MVKRGGEGIGEDFAWSRGLGYEISPIKTRSARKKDGTNTNFFAQQISNKSKIGVLRGVGGSLKITSLCRLLLRTLPDIVFLQETLVDEKKARHFMVSLRLTWLMCAISPVGMSE
jgi:hypothetical protein